MKDTTWVAIGLIVAWGLYRRARRTIGFQKLSRGRLLFRIGLLLLVGVAIVAAGAFGGGSLPLDAAGSAAGAAIAYLGTKATTFEQRGAFWYYRPNTWIGLLVLLLFIGRLASRAAQTSALFRPGEAPGAGTLAASAADPLTTGLLLVFVVYNMAFALFLLRKAPHLERAESA